MNWRFWQRDRAESPLVDSGLPHKQQLGAIGERIAVAHLIKQHGLKVVAQNYRAGRSELDVVAYDAKRSILRVVEVKTRMNSSREVAYESLTASKMASLHRGAMLFREEYYEKYPAKELFFDLVIVLFASDGSYTVEYVPNIEID